MEEPYLRREKVWTESSRWSKEVNFEDQLVMQTKKFRRNRFSIYVLQRAALKI